MRVSIGAIAACLLWQAPAVAQSDSMENSGQPNSSVDAEARLGTVLITASRREESLKDVPIAVSAFSGEDLSNAQIDSLEELASLAPGLQISSAYTNANINIRGVGNSQLTAGSEPGVAFHLDGAYIAQPLLTLSSFLDVERVEVLRGPQGTLFGRNATGGAINLIPNKPTEELDIGISVSFATDPNELRTDAFISGPLNESGSLLGRFAVQLTENDGFTDNLVPSGPDTLDDQSNYAARGQIEWKPSETFRSRLSVETQNADDSGPAAFLIGTPDPSQPLPMPLLDLPVGSEEDRTTFANVGTREIEAFSISSTSVLSSDIGDLKALIFYNDSDIEILQDGDGTSAEFTSTNFGNDSQQFFGELIFTSDLDSDLNFIVGANYFQEELDHFVSVPVSFLPIPIDLGANLESTSYAAFVAADYALSDQLEVFGGLRYTNDEKDIDEFNVFIGDLQQDESWSEVTYEIGASYAFAPNATAYIKHNTGFKGGGFSAGSLAPAFSPETNSNFEIGLKGSYFENTLNANLVAFHTNYDDLQVNQVVGVSAAVTNAAKATLEGFEAEVVFDPTDVLRIQGSLSLLDATFDEFSTLDSARPALGVLDLTGNSLPNAPDSSASLGVYYDTSVFGGVLTYGARWDWSSREFFNEFNTSISSQDSVSTIDLNLNYVSADNRWRASLYALNATDETVRSNVIIVSALLGSLGLAQLDPGRQVGASIGYRF